MAHLDSIDLRILSDLQHSGRMTNVDLAKNAGISAPPCLRRVRGLEERGYIKSYHAKLSAQKLEFGITVFVMVSLSQHKASDLDAFCAAVNEWPRVRECHLLTGGSDIFLKVVARDWDDYQNFLTESLMAMPLVKQVQSNVSVRIAKDAPGLPLELLETEALQKAA